ncbi:hypothetical protein IPZ58_09405 [Streptomyces roseoverticillatus]|uniref:hypothetical protein n=1 Tax=Streptomyces roseoverticillatus TaxID=66429 RepID=UPI001F2565D1|nr:hypothetical protein [Streptomyces roseoverticillatus]MCF3101799.1 hypothetical protein [Streptomyces roseoverticillatus]
MNPTGPRKARRLAAAVAITAAALTPTTQTAHADGRPAGVLLACAGTVAASYAPGLTYAPKATSVTSRAVVGCPLSTDNRFASAAFGGDSAGALSCLLGPASGTLTFHWGGNKGEGKSSPRHGDHNDHGDTTSTASIRSLAAVRPNGNIVTVSTGTITDGVFKGAAVVTEVTLLASQQAACLTPEGLTSASGPTTVTITRV